ncbi:MAG: cyclodeaminase/cyclohydrolase family protein [Clostridiales bacterium]|nr:cyclodeaminase/cyclohydrolase family protein [Clostridiales bacterium]
MKLADTNISEYLDILKSDKPAPGGGSASCLAGAQGAALLVMVCNLTLGRAKYAEFQEACGNVQEKAQELLKTFITAIDEDTEAFNMVSKAYKMPKETDQQKKDRSVAIQEGMLRATKIPFFVMKTTREGLAAAAAVVGKTNTAAMSDLGVAVLSFQSCCRGAWLNVKINLLGMKNEEKASFYRNEGQKLYEDVERIADELYEGILKSI